MNKTAEQIADEILADLDIADEPKVVPFKNSSGGTHVDQEIDRLARLAPYAYDLVREHHAAELSIRVGTLDKAVGKRRKKLEEDKTPPPFSVIEPWHEAVDCGALLADIARVLASHVIMPAGAATAIALWTLHAHAHDSADISPILGTTSPTPECGKTTLLTFLGAVVPRPLPASNITSAALFRAVEKWHPTLLVDEADTFLRDSDELRGVLNSGHNRANASVIRTVGDDYEPRAFKTWAPKAIACIGRLPATLASRAIHIELRRKGIGEQVVALRPDRLGHLQVLARKAARWAADNLEALKTADPEMPAPLTGRRADNWRHMLAIADLAGGTWPARARKAAEAMIADDDNEVAGILLLQDLRSYFENHNTDRISSLDLVGALHEMLERPWTEWGKQGKPISEGQVAKLLKGFKVKPRTIRVGERTSKGYLQEQFNDVFARYLPPQMPLSPYQGVTPSQVSDINGLQGIAAVTNENNVTARSPSNHLKNNDCDGVTPPKGKSGSEGNDIGSGPHSSAYNIHRNPEDRRPPATEGARCDHCHQPGANSDPLVEVFDGQADAQLHRRCMGAWLTDNGRSDGPEIPPFLRRSV